MLESFRDLGGKIDLQCEHGSERAVIRRVQEALASLDVDECRDDAHGVAMPSRAPLDDVIDAELAADALNVTRSPFVGERGGARSDAEATDLGERAGELFRD